MNIQLSVTQFLLLGLIPLVMTLGLPLVWSIWVRADKRRTPMVLRGQAHGIMLMLVVLLPVVSVWVAWILVGAASWLSS